MVGIKSYVIPNLNRLGRNLFDVCRLSFLTGSCNKNVSLTPPLFIEVTTRSGKWAVM